MSLSARDEILARIRTALPGDPLDPPASHAAITRSYERHGELSPEATLELFIDRLLDYDTEILQIAGESGLPAAIAEAMQRAAQTTVLASASFPAAWLPPNINVELDHHLSTAEIDRVPIVLTTCEVGVASTGTLILVHGEVQARRALTLLPDIHICLVRRDQVVQTIPEALSAIAAQSMRPLTTISGPSATSDIEMTRVRGVHGPRRLIVILYGELKTRT